MKTYHYVIKGRVQGVSFRYYTNDFARENDIKGTVKNLYNGDVEVYAQGKERDITNFEKYLSRGPALAIVDQVMKEELESEQVYPDFRIVF